MDSTSKLSLVCPVRNEEASIGPFLARLVPVMEGILSVDYEVVFVNDGSTDRTLERLLEAQDRNPAIRVVDLSRSFGKEAALTAGIEKICTASAFNSVTNGRFRGGWITRHYGKPETGVHALQMELAMRGYLYEPKGALNEHNWPAMLDDAHAATLRVALRDILDVCLKFATGATA